MKLIMFREEIFRAVAQSELPGLIFPAEVCDVELEANVSEGLERNKSSNHLLHKPTKRDIAWAEGNFFDAMRQFRLNSDREKLHMSIIFE